MLDLINKNIDFLMNYPIFQNNNELIKNIVDKLNKDRIVVVTWVRWLNKTSIIKEFLEKTGNKNFFYFNDELDSENLIKNDQDFFKLFDLYENKLNKCNILVLQNINKIENIKNILSKLYKNKDYKILIFWNNIHIDKSREIEIPNNIFQPNEILTKELVENYLNFWSIPDVKLLNNNYFKKSTLEHIKNKVVLKDIINNYSIKSDILFNQVISKIALLGNSLSIRELHRNIKESWINISLITLMDYIDFAVNAKIIKRCFTYDLKLDKPINTKVKYYFSDIGIRNTFAGKKIDDNILVENLIYNDLITEYNEIYNGMNWRFDFGFYINDNSRFIHISSETEKNEIKKEINKLDKIEQKWDKVLVLSNLDMINYEKVVSWVRVVWAWEYKK